MAAAAGKDQERRNVTSYLSFRGALDIIERLRTGPMWNQFGRLIWSFQGLNGMMSDATLAKVLRTNGGTGYTVHGFRSSFRDWAAENGFADAWAEAALAHTNPNRTESAYRRTTFFEQRKDRLMPAWASFALGSSDNVVRLAAR